MGLRQRLENLVVNPRLIKTGTDLDFAKSLLEYYNRKGGLSTGRRPWLDKLEEKYDESNWVDPLDNDQGHRLDALLSNEALTGRDRSFAESLRNGVARFGQLTDRQASALESIESRYSEEGVAKRDDWREQYLSSGMKRRAEIAAAYYAANPPYYGDLAARILGEESFIPTERQYNKMVNNKYATKVIDATLAEPKYPVNSIVEARSGTPATRRLSGAKAFVLQTDHTAVTSAAKGCKQYLILPVGSPTPITVEERWIKKAKGI